MQQGVISKADSDQLKSLLPWVYPGRCRHGCPGSQLPAGQSVGFLAVQGTLLPALREPCGRGAASTVVCGQQLVTR